MDLYPSKLGKRKTREIIKNQKKGYKKPINKIYTKVTVFLGLVSLVILVFFYWALGQGVKEDTEPNKYVEVSKALKEIGNPEIFSDQALVSMKEKALERENLTFSGKTMDQRLRNPGVLDNEIKLYLRENEIPREDFSFVYYNFENKLYLGINESEEFHAASVSKVPVVAYLFDLAHEGEVDLNTRLILREEDKTEGDGKLKDQRPGTSYRLYDLARLMITESDNTATNMVYDYLGKLNGEFALDSLARVYGISTYDGNIMTADDGLLILDRIFKNEDHNPCYVDLLNFMAHTDSNDFFTRDLEGPISHKTGFYKEATNDMGIVYSDNGRFAFAVFTRNLGEEGPDILSHIGGIVNAWHRGQIK